LIYISLIQATLWNVSPLGKRFEDVRGTGDATKHTIHDPLSSTTIPNEHHGLPNSGPGRCQLHIKRNIACTFAVLIIRQTTIGWLRQRLFFFRRFWIYDRFRLPVIDRHRYTVGWKFGYPTQKRPSEPPQYPFVSSPAVRIRVLCYRPPRRGNHRATTRMERERKDGDGGRKVVLGLSALVCLFACPCRRLLCIWFQWALIGLRFAEAIVSSIILALKLTAAWYSFSPVRLCLMILRYAVTASADYAYSRDSRPIMEATLSLSPRTVTTLPFLVSAAVAHFLHLGNCLLERGLFCGCKPHSPSAVVIWSSHLDHTSGGVAPESVVSTCFARFWSGAPLIDTFSPIALHTACLWSFGHCNHPSSVLSRGRYPSWGH
jgi:hypothetical protein